MSYRQPNADDSGSWEGEADSPMRTALLGYPSSSPRKVFSVSQPRQGSFSLSPRRPLSTVVLLMLITLLLALSIGIVERRHVTLLAGLHSVAPHLTSFLHPHTGSKHCNPFAQRGYVHNSPSVTDVFWQPFNTSSEQYCHPSRLFERHFLSSDPTPASWLQGRNHTIFLIGDSIDRWHLWDVCEMMKAREKRGGNTHAIEHLLEKIGPDHPASPTPYMTSGAPISYRRKEIAMSKRDWNPTRPWVCRIRSDMGGNNATSAQTWLNLVNIFTFGIEDLGTMHDHQKFYYPPASFSNRLKHIVLPLIENLAAYYSDPSMSAPSLIEFQSGMWDLRRWSQEDLDISEQKPAFGNIPSMSSVFTDLNSTRVERQINELREMILEVGETFAARKAPAKIAVPLSFRALHFVSEHHYWAPWPRAYTLDSIDRQVISDLWQESRFDRKSRAAALKLHERLRINEWARLIEGQGDKFRDHAHPALNPGTVIWADYILWELRRAIELQFS